MEDSYGWVIKGIKFIRWLPAGRKIIHSVKSYAIHSVVAPLHLEVAHSLRDLSIKLLDPVNYTEQSSREAATYLCTASAHLMAGLIGHGENQVHCCLKVFTEGTSIEETGVATFARSTPGDNRPLGDADIHYIDNTNTVWCALLGRNDGENNWEDRIVNCFACNNLQNHPREFKCDRTNWNEYYQSALVYPLRCFDPSKPDSETDTYGFLAFDSPKKDAFPGLPDIFDFWVTGEKRSEYHDLLRDLPYFHVGALIADSLGVVLKPFYEGRRDSAILID